MDISEGEIKGQRVKKKRYGIEERKEHRQFYIQMLLHTYVVLLVQERNVDHKGIRRIFELPFPLFPVWLTF